MKKRSFAFAIVYIKCFRTYSVYLSLRLPAQILYAGIHLPPQREARALPRRALSRRFVTLHSWLSSAAGRGYNPLSHRGVLIKGIKALVCPFAVLRSRFGLRYSRVRGRRQSKFLASSSTGGARNFYPYTGEPRFALRFPRRVQGSHAPFAPCSRE